MMKVLPVINHPALSVQLDSERVLIVADLHLGVEGELSTRGVSLPSQVPNVKRRLEELIRKEKPDRLVLLGDVKHNVPASTWQEWTELPSLFRELSKLTEVEIVKGNHDGDIEGMVVPGVTVHGARGIVLGGKKRVGLMHGHTWPAPSLWKTELLICAHNHPAVEFRLGGRIIEPVWLRCQIDVSKLPTKQRKLVRKAPKLLVMPAFGELVGGFPVNRSIPEGLLGPLFRSGAVRLSEAEVYLLDGAYLGRVRQLPGVNDFED